MVSLVWGALAFGGMMIGFWPSLIGVSWVNLPFAAPALLVSLLAVARPRGENNAPGIAGLLCSAIAVTIGVLRLTLGTGIL